MTVHRRYTSADLDSLPDIPGVRYEIVDGELSVSKQPTWEHETAVHGVYDALAFWSRANGSGYARQGPGLVFAEEDDVVPDVIWIRRGRMAGALDRSHHLSVAPDLVVEVLSPGAANERRAREIKLDLYSRRGVQEYWIVDWQLHTVQIYRRHEQALTLASTAVDGDTLTSPLLPGFSLKVDDIWEPTS